MDLKKLPQKLKDGFHKYKFVMLILMIGIVLMLIPMDKDVNKTPQTAVQNEPEKTLNEELAEILGLIDGAGNVQVLLTISAGEEIVYQLDEDISNEADASASELKTVIITNSEKAQSGLIKQINPPQYLGAVILCEGADSPVVRLAVIDAVSKVTGLGTDKISVVKMK